MPSVIAVEGSVTVPFAPGDLWPFVADANRMDHAVGLPAAKFTRTMRPEGGEEVRGEYHKFGIRIARWREYPFEWERPRYFSVIRTYDSGPLTRFFGGAELTPVDDGTTIRVFAEFTPRNLLSVPVVRMYIAPLSIRRAIRQYQHVAAFLAGRSIDPFPESSQSPIDTEQLEGCMLRMQAESVPPKPAEKLKQMLSEATDEETYGMRPLALARRWGTDVRETLHTFLHGTMAGLLEMRWELVCPSCRGVKATSTHLKDLEVTGYCAACNLPFAASVGEAIEARFYPSPKVRDVNVGTYCVGSPMNTPHRLAQTSLDPEQTREWHLHLAPGPYAIRSPQSKAIVRLTVEPGAATEPLDVRLDREEAIPAEATVAPGEVRLRITNAAPHNTTIALDDLHWSETAATPGKLLTFPAFHSLFSAEALESGVELSIARVGLIFTDLAGSTALYEEAGEAAAFRLVGAHFAILRAAIERSDGAMIKTIGDAVMGAFPDGASALAAALAIQRDICDLDTNGLADPAHLVKVGVHVGPCYIVTLNGRLDYFGTTVNVTARAQHEAHGGEIVATADAMDEGAELVLAAGLPVTPFQIHLRGLSQPVELFRIDATAERSELVELPGLRGEQPR